MKKWILMVLAITSVVIVYNVQGQLSVTNPTADDIFTRLVSVETDITHGETKFEFECLFDSCKIGDDLDARFVEAKGSPIIRYEYYVWDKIEVPEYGPVLQDQTCERTVFKDPGNVSTTEYYDCSWNKTMQIGTKLIDGWKKINPGLVLNKGKHSIKIRAYWKAQLGEREIDWIPTLNLNKADYPELDNTKYIEQTKWAWWSGSWDYKKPLFLNQSGTKTIDDLLVYVELDTATLIAAGKMQGDCDDIRIVNGSETGELPFFFSNRTSSTYGCNQSATGLYLPADIPTTNTTIYLYYGNGAASDGENRTGAINEADVNFFVPFSEESGSTAYDFARQENMTANDNAGYTASGKVGYATSMDGTDDYWSTDGYAAVGDGLTAFTYMWWMYKDGAYSVGYSHLGSETQGSGDNESMYIRAENGRTDFRFGIKWSDDTWLWIYTNVTYSATTWYHQAYVYDGAKGQHWRDAVAVGTSAAASKTSKSHNGNFRIGGSHTASQEWDGDVDEFIVYERALNDAEIKRNYQFGLYSFGSEENDLGAVVNLTITNPKNQTYATSKVSLNVTTDNNADACIYSLDGAANVSLDSYNATYWHEELIGLSDGPHGVVVMCNASNNDYDSKYWVIDTSPPGITIHLPENVTYDSLPVYLNVSANETIDSWLYSLNGAANKSFTPNITITPNPGSNYIWVYANDSIGNMGSQGPVYFTYFNYTAGSTTYNSDVIEGSTQNFQMFLNFSIIGQVSDVSGYLYYNGSTHTAAATLSGTGYLFNVSIDVGDANLSCCEKQTNAFYWNYSFTSYAGDETNTTQNESQTVHKIILTNCSNATLTNTKTLWFNIYDEENSSSVISDMEIAFDSVWYTGDPEREWAWAGTGQNNYPVCIYPSWAEYTVDSMSQFEKEGAAYKNYYLDNATINNVTENISIYLGSNETADLIQMEVLDHLGMPKPYVVITAQRYFIGENVYRTTGVFKTDFQGQASGYLIKNTIWYRFIISEAGETLEQFEPMTINADEIVFRLSSEGLGEWFQYHDGIAYNCTTSTTTNSTTCTVSDSTGLMVNATLDVREYTTLGWIDTCTSYGEASSVTLVCSLGATQNKLFYYVLTVEMEDSEYELEAGWLDYRAGASQWGSLGLVIAIFLILFMVMIGSFDPRIAMVLSGVGLGLSYGFGFVYISYGSLVALFIVIGIAVYKYRG